MNQMIQVGSTDHVISATDHTVSLRPDIDCGKAPQGLQAAAKRMKI